MGGASRVADRRELPPLLVTRRPSPAAPLSPLLAALASSLSPSLALSAAAESATAAEPAGPHAASSSSAAPAEKGSSLRFSPFSSFSALRDSLGLGLPPAAVAAGVYDDVRLRACLDRTARAHGSGRAPDSL